MRAAWPPVFSQYHVDMVFNGHDHNFEVTHPLAGDGTVATDPTMGTTYYTAAGGGAMLYASATSAWTLHSESVMNFLLVHATEHTLEVTPYRLDGTIITAGHITLSR